MFNTIGNVDKKFITGLYIRLSKEDDNIAEGESESVNNQKNLLINYANSQDYKIYDTYVDDGYTGTNFNRPAFQRMLEDIKSGKINMVITKDLSRLSRDYIGTGEYVEKWFPAHDVRYIALTDNIDTFIDSSNNDIAPFKAILNDMYAKDLSKKIRTALHTMQQDGKWVGGCTPYGYITDPNNKNKLIVHELEGIVIKRIFNLINEGKKINEIKNLLNEENVPTFAVSRGRNFKRSGNAGDIYGLWCNTTIKKILQNRLYTGDMIQNRRSRVSYKYRKIISNASDKWIIVENTHEALIEREVFDKIQKLLPKNQQRQDKKEIFLLDGLLKCYECGSSLGIRARDTKRKNKSYTVCNKYRRYKKENNLCTSHGNDYDKLEKIVVEHIKTLIKSFDIDCIEDKLKERTSKKNPFGDIDKKIQKFQYEVGKCNSNLEKIYFDKIEGKIEEGFFNQVYNKIKNDILLYEKKIEDLNIYKEEIKENASKSKDLKIIINEFLSLESPTRELMIKLINRIDVHEDKIIDIHFNFKELNFINN